MKYLLLSVTICILLVEKLSAQALVKMEYMGNSSYRDANNKKLGDAEGTAIIWQGAFSVPLSVQMNENNQPTAWAIALAGSYTDFRNRNLSRDLSPEEIMNLDLVGMHIRPINAKWSAMFMVGIGIYTPHTDFSQIQMRNVLGNGGALAIYHLRKNLKLGFGLVLNNSFGYPMVFPGAILEWTVEGKYEVNVNMVSGIEITAGMQMNKYLKLYILADMNGAMSLEKREGKNMMFTHQYVNVGLQPVIQLGKGFSLPVTVGMTPYRAAYYKERTLKAFFSDDGEYDPHFSPSFYFSTAIRYGF